MRVQLGGLGMWCTFRCAAVYWEYWAVPCRVRCCALPPGSVEHVHFKEGVAIERRLLVRQHN